MKSFYKIAIAIFLLFVVTSTSGGILADSFLTVDCNNGLFSDGQNTFPLVCVTYVQPDPNWPGANSGRVLVYILDPMKIRQDFKKMRELGVNSIYMRIGAGLFLNTDGSWRKLDDSVTGIPTAMFQRFSLEQIQAERAATAEAGIGPFTYNYELFDYLLDCAQAEGIYVVPAILDSWSVPRKYERSVINTALFYEKTWHSIINDWTKIIGRLKNRKCIAGWLIDGELMCTFQTWTDEEWFFLGDKGERKEAVVSPLESYDPEITSRFRDFLKNRYGTIENLKSAWQYGYDRANPTFNSNTKIPFHEFKAGVFDLFQSFDEINLPITERPQGSVTVGRGKNFPYWSNVPLDPKWIDFNYFRQQLFVTRLNEFIAKMRQVDPNHLFFYSAAADMLPAWHPFIVAWSHGNLDCEVLLHGGGYPRSVNQSAKQPDSYETIMELYKSVGLYRPSTSSGLKGCVFGMGEGGLSFESNNPKARTENMPEALQDRWVSQILMDNYGSGGGFTNVWDWGTITGATVERPELHEQEVAGSIKAISSAMKLDSFSKNRNAKILILASGPALNSMMNGVSLNNIISLASCLAMTHCGFDIVTTDEISFGESSDKVDINKYDAIFMPHLYQVPELQTGPYTQSCHSGNIWIMIDKWLQAKNDRLLCLGLIGNKNTYFAPMSTLPAELQSIVGDIEIGDIHRVTPNEGKNGILKTACDQQLDISLDGIFIQDISIGNTQTSQIEPFLMYNDNVLGVKRTLNNNSKVYQLGLPLGLSWTPLLDKDLSGKGIEEKQTPELAKFYKKLLNEVGIEPVYDAHESIVAYISDNAEIIFVRQRFNDGPRAGKLLSSQLITGHIYSGVKTVTTMKNGKVTAEIVGDLGANLASVLTSVGTVEMIKDGTTEITVEPIDCEGTSKYNIEVTGAESAKIQLDVWKKP